MKTYPCHCYENAQRVKVFLVTGVISNISDRSFTLSFVATATLSKGPTFPLKVVKVLSEQTVIEPSDDWAVQLRHALDNGFEVTDESGNKVNITTSTRFGGVDFLFKDEAVDFVLMTSTDEGECEKVKLPHLCFIRGSFSGSVSLRIDTKSVSIYAFEKGGGFEEKLVHRLDKDSYVVRASLYFVDKWSSKQVSELLQNVITSSYGEGLRRKDIDGVRVYTSPDEQFVFFVDEDDVWGKAIHYLRYGISTPLESFPAELKKDIGTIIQDHMLNILTNRSHPNPTIQIVDQMYRVSNQLEDLRKSLYNIVHNL